jgi:sensor histidine kinase YesM
MNERFVEISVKDNGIGIKKDKLNTIFNKFNQIIAKNSGPARSTGLGLTFCKLAVEAHEGEIMVESEQGVYTIFKFTLPKSDEVYFRSSTEIKSSVFYEIFLNYEEKKYLERIVGELSKTDVYDIGNLRKLTLMIDDSKSIHIEKWKKELQRSIYNCNLEYYNELIKIASITQNE